MVEEILESLQAVLFQKVNALVQDHTMVLSWFSYTRGIKSSDYGLGTALGVFQSVVGVTLLMIANKIASLVGEDKLV